ncbi:MAG: peptidase M17 [Deltaproteobacteria bacterium RIFOXYD12_FULL_55_16]|nr:MAG: peptidase M17 [Deltaproteobacteria bacterium RIFOXYD12_FULL_55_16]
MLSFSKIGPETYAGDLLVYLARQSDKGAYCCASGEVDEVICRVYGLGDFSGKEGEQLLFYPEHERQGIPTAKRILVVGLGKEVLSRELFRKAGGTIASLAMKSKAQELLLVLPDLACDKAEMVEGLSEGLVLGAYRFKKYKTKKEPDSSGEMLQQAALYAVSHKGLDKALKLGEIGAQAACKARDMANEPASHWTPGHFSEYGRQLAATHGMTCTVLNQARMEKLGMGGILGVNQGSAMPPEMVILEYAGKPGAPTLLLVGKGLTFDSGGISLKPSVGMEEMKYDMCGGAAVLCAMQAVAQARLKGLNLVAIVPATENLPGPAALKPGDVITQYGGKTVEVVNTDAEGRLILADALAYGIKKYKPDMVIDVATLTGAVIVGLGHHRTGLLANNDNLSARLLAAGERSGEPLWRLPLDQEYTKQLKSGIADLKNVGKKDGGAITAAAFLKEFVGDTPWAHLDIAGTAWDFTEKSYIPKGPSGIAVRTLFDFVRNWKG